MIGKLVRIPVVASFLLASGGCSAARPAHPLMPAYPVMLASAGHAGQLVATVQVERTGRAHVLESDVPMAGTSGLFTRALEAEVANVAWRPARRFGIARRETQQYHVAFVLLRDTLPVGAGERVIAGNAEAPITCPLAHAPREVVVCAVPGRVRYVESH